jgi:hypothetical protein
MRPSILLMTMTATVALTASACSSGIHVRTTTAPDASFTGLHTFRVLNAPERRVDAPPLSANDPMLDNSITNRELRQDLVQGLESKGYALDRDNPDFVVAYYAGTKEKMDTTYWNPDPWWRYGYRGYRYGWAWPWYGYAAPYPVMRVQEYTQGSVIVDVVDPRTKELLWRGQGVAQVSDDPNAYAKELSKTVGAVLKKFPHA